MVRQYMRNVVGVTTLAVMAGACTENSAPVAGAPVAAKRAVAALDQGVSVVHADAAGAAQFIVGELGEPTVAAEGQRAAAGGMDMSAVLANVAPRFRLDAAQLVLKRHSVDAQGDTHYRYAVLHNGLPVLGGEVLLHLRNGKVFAANTNMRGDLQAAAKADIAADAAKAAVAGDKAAPIGARIEGEPELRYWRVGDELKLVYELRQTGELEDGTPVDDSVLVSAIDGSVVERLPHVHTGRNRTMYDGKTLTTLPGTLARTETAPPVADPVVNTNFDHLGSVYACYQQLFARDSFNNAGATMLSTVHHRVRYVNAFWNGTQMVYGDGDNVTASNLANSLDVTAHELTHAVTDYESDLIYSGESGGLNESMSDIFAAVCEWHARNKVVDANTWKVGEDVWTPATPGDALRYMNTPTLDGVSLDYFPDYSAGTGVHYSSGISNLAFYLLSQGGTHPRAKTTTVVAGLGIEKAARIFYKANTDLMTPSTTFEQAKVATEQAAAQLGYDAATVTAVSNAWKAVGVGVPVPPPPTTPIQKGVPVTNLAGARNSRVYFSVNVPEGATDLKFTMSGGTGDADLYVRFANAPTDTLYNCRPFSSGNNETCTIAAPAEGTWYAMIKGFSAYSGVTLNVTWTGGYIPINNGDVIEGLSGAAGSAQVFKVNMPEGISLLKASIHGGSGNADIYVRKGGAPTHSNYDCRDVKENNQEHCNFNRPAAARYYILVFGAKAFSDVRLEVRGVP